MSLTCLRGSESENTWLETHRIPNPPLSKNSQVHRHEKELQTSAKSSAATTPTRPCHGGQAAPGSVRPPEPCPTGPQTPKRLRAPQAGDLLPSRARGRNLGWEPARRRGPPRPPGTGVSGPRSPLWVPACASRGRSQASTRVRPAPAGLARSPEPRRPPP